MNKMLILRFFFFLHKVYTHNYGPLFSASNVLLVNEFGHQYSLTLNIVKQYIKLFLHKYSTASAINLMLKRLYIDH